MRGIGSGSFVLATLGSGFVVAAFGLPSIIVLASVLILLMAVPLPWLAAPKRSAAGAPLAGVLELLAVPAFTRILLVAGLVIGSQSMSDTFAAIHWRNAGVSPRVVGALWSEAVASELVVFLLVGPYLLRRLGPGRCATLGALAGIVQWGSLALTANPALLALSQPLHGFTFALTHLSVMAVIAAAVPDERAATAQALYGTLCLGLASAAITMASGWLVGGLGGARVLDHVGPMPRRRAPCAHAATAHPPDDTLAERTRPALRVPDGSARPFLAFDLGLGAGAARARAS